MSATFQILSPISPREMLDLERACMAAVEAYLDEHPDCEDQWGEIGAGGPIPRQPEVVAAYRRYRLDLPDVVVERLSRCRSSMMIDRPGDLDADRLQVSILCFLLERAGEGLIMFNDYPLVDTTAALLDLRRRRGVRGFVVEALPRPRKIRRREARAGEVRAIRIVRLLRAAQESPDFAVDVRRVLAGASEVARRYAALLMEEGAVDDRKATQALGVPAEVLEREATALDTALLEVS